MPESRVWAWYGLALLVVVLDQLTKGLARALLVYGQPLAVLPIFDLSLHFNPGAAFSFLAGAGGWQRWFLSALALVVSAVLLVWLARLRREQWLLALALALILGGAIGNLIDRLWLGHVTDFIALHWNHRYFPAFNLADAAITLGAIALILDTLLHPAQHGSKPRE